MVCRYNFCTKCVPDMTSYMFPDASIHFWGAKREWSFLTGFPKYGGSFQKSLILLLRTIQKKCRVRLAFSVRVLWLNKTFGNKFTLLNCKHKFSGVSSRKISCKKPVVWYLWLKLYHQIDLVGEIRNQYRILFRDWTNFLHNIGTVPEQSVA